MTLDQRRGLQGRADTQALLGERVLVTSVRGIWAHVVVPDQPTPLDARGYPGWVPVSQLAAVAPPTATQLATVLVRTAWMWADDVAVGRVIEVSYGTELPVLGRSERWVRVGLPGGVVRRIDVSAVTLHEVRASALPATGVSLVRSATLFTGLSYLWAGRSGFGFDCSGLTSLVYRVHGIVIPRDADAQFRAGHPVSQGGALPGDLLFYATANGYVHHVSMYAGLGQLVHAPATGKTVQTIAVATPAYAAESVGARSYLP